MGIGTDLDIGLDWIGFGRIAFGWIMDTPSTSQVQLQLQRQLEKERYMLCSALLCIVNTALGYPPALGFFLHQSGMRLPDLTTLTRYLVPKVPSLKGGHASWLKGLFDVGALGVAQDSKRRLFKYR